MASYETLLLERRGRVAVITINRPTKLNALNIQTRTEGAAALDELRDDESVRVVVITGAGEKAFVAGGEIPPFRGGPGGPPAARVHARSRSHPPPTLSPTPTAR